MISRAKASTNGSVGIGSALLAAQLGGVVSATDDELVSPAPVTGTGQLVWADCFREDLEDTDELYRSMFTCEMTWSMSDPRLEGEVMRISESVDLGSEELAAVRTDDGDWPRISVAAYSIRNDDGVWLERPRPAVWTVGTDSSSWPLEAVTTMVFDGHEGYEGLVAVLQRDVPEAGDHSFTGFIVDASLMPTAPRT